MQRPAGNMLAFGGSLGVSPFPLLRLVGSRVFRLFVFCVSRGRPRLSPLLVPPAATDMPTFGDAAPG